MSCGGCLRRQFDGVFNQILSERGAKRDAGRISYASRPVYFGTADHAPSHACEHSHGVTCRSTMASAQVVITQANGETPAIGGLFEGLSFFLVQRLPSRSSFIQKIQSNGGRFVKLEAQADHIIADHIRPELCPAGSISYTFIDKALLNGALPDPGDHAAGSLNGTVRDVGSAVPGKSTRTPFTAEDDRVLWQWVERCKADSAFVKGNEIYKQLERQNPRHTFQAWRDRYVKRLMHKPPAGVQVTVAANPPPSPPTAQDGQPEIVGETSTLSRKTRSPKTKQGAAPAQSDGAHELDLEPEEPEPESEPQNPDPQLDFTQEDFDNLIREAQDIEDMQEDRVEEAWQLWARTSDPQHTVESWRRFYEENVRPVYLERQEAGKNAEGNEAKKDAANEGASDAEERTLTMSDRPKSSSPVKRKRETSTPHARRTYGQKKQKTGGADVFGQDGSGEELLEQHSQAGPRPPPNPSTQPIEIPSDDEDEDEEQTDADLAITTSERNAAAHMQLDQEQERAAAQAQFDEEVLGLPAAGALVKGAVISNLPTPEINRSADEQLRRESIEPQANEDGEEDNDEDDEASQPPIPALLSSQANNAEQSTVADAAPMEPLEAEGNALTEANLASQQAQHKAQPFRGVDLPQDDEMQDQSAYIQFLQDVVPDTEVLKQQAKDNDTKLPANILALDDGLEPESILELPMSSQQEVSEALEDPIQWPSPPERPRRREAQPKSIFHQPSQSMPFETQIAYPDLPSQYTDFAPQQDDEHVFSSQLAGEQLPIYPSLPQQDLQSETSEKEILEPEVSSPPSTINEFEFIEQENSCVEVEDGESQAALSIEEGDEDDIDLAIPEPEGGWGFSSSPAKAIYSQQSPSKPTRHTKPSAERPESIEDAEEEVEEEEDGFIVDQEIVERLSSSPSSSSSSSEDSSESDPEPPRPLETQDILNAETQQPDLAMPLPPESDDESQALPSDPPGATQPPAGQRNVVESQKIPDEDVNDYINTMIVRGYKESSVVKALKCTSMRPDLAELVLLEEKAGKGFPRDVAGVWSEEEDRKLEGGNAGMIKELEAKHSWEECAERMVFLQEWREEEGEGEWDQVEVMK